MFLGGSGRDRHLKNNFAEVPARAGAAFSAKRAAETAHREYAVLTEFKTFPDAPGGFFSLWTTPIVCLNRRPESVKVHAFDISE